MSRSVETLAQPFKTRVKRWLGFLGEFYQAKFTITSTRRSRADQKRLYRRFLRGESAFPALPPGQSRHEHGNALDIVFHPEPDGALTLEQIGALAARFGIHWAGAGDSVHFDNRPAPAVENEGINPFF